MTMQIAGRSGGLAIILAVLASTAQADWVKLDGTAIAAALTDRKLVYDNAWQEFRASGRTLYNAGSDSWGYWSVRGDQYCSQWPPGDLWACYDLERSGEQLRFVAGDGSATVGDYAE